MLSMAFMVVRNALIGPINLLRLVGLIDVFFLISFLIFGKLEKRLKLSTSTRPIRTRIYGYTSTWRLIGIENRIKA